MTGARAAAVMGLLLAVAALGGSGGRGEETFHSDLPLDCKRCHLGTGAAGRRRTSG